jgi:hypothetical protein
MIVRVAVVPHPPILMLEVAAGAAGETAATYTLRAPGYLDRRAEGLDAAVAAAQALAPAWQGELLYSAVRYGVAYHVGLWDAVDPDPQL